MAASADHRCRRTEQPSGSGPGQRPQHGQGRHRDHRHRNPSARVQVHRPPPHRQRPSEGQHGILKIQEPGPRDNGSGACGCVRGGGGTAPGPRHDRGAPADRGTGGQLAASATWWRPTHEATLTAAQRGLHFQMWSHPWEDRTGENRHDEGLDHAQSGRTKWKNRLPPQTDLEPCGAMPSRPPPDAATGRDHRTSTAPPHTSDRPRHELFDGYNMAFVRHDGCGFRAGDLMSPTASRSRPPTGHM